MLAHVVVIDFISYDIVALCYIVHNVSVMLVVCRRGILFSVVMNMDMDTCRTYIVTECTNQCKNSQALLLTHTQPQYVICVYAVVDTDFCYTN